MKSLQGQVVVLMEGGNAFGRSLALELARIGARLALWHATGAVAQRVVEEVRRTSAITAHAYEADLQHADSIDAACRAVFRDFGRLDVLICNVDLLFATPFFNGSEDTITESIKWNALAPMHATRSALATSMLPQNHGHIVLFGTQADALGAPRLVDYCTSKHTIKGFYECIQHELRHSTGIHTTLILPTLLERSQERDQNHQKSIWVPVDVAAKQVVRAVRKNQSVSALPSHFQMMQGLLQVLPERLQQWCRRKLGWSLAMDNMIVPTATPYAFTSL